MSIGSPISIGIVGDEPVLNSIAAMILTQTDMRIAAVAGGTSILTLAQANGIAIERTRDAVAKRCQIMIEFNQECGLALFSNGAPDELESDSGRSIPVAARQQVEFERANKIAIPHSDIVAVSRVVDCLQSILQIQQLMGTVVRPCESRKAASIGLRPFTEDQLFNQPLIVKFRNILSNCSLRFVAAPIADVTLWMVQFALSAPTHEAAIIERLAIEPRIMLGHAHEGFRSTADVSEYFRDLPRPRGDQWEVFIWLDSLMCRDSKLYLTACHSGCAVSVPDSFDAIESLRSISNGQCNDVSITNQRFGLTKSRGGHAF